MFAPYSQFPDPILTGMYLNTALVVRTSGEPTEVVSSLRGALRDIDPTQPLVNVRTMESAMAATVAYPRFQMTLLMIFAGVAVTLAAVGVYGVMAYTVTQRTQEIGVRLAVGASPGQVVSMVVWQGARLGLIGVAIGLAAGVIVAGAMRSLLFGIDMIDPVTFVTAPVVLAVAALIAAYVPARRAANVSPLTALR
jgi:putative ABC transport system permease protein